MEDEFFQEYGSVIRATYLLLELRTDTHCHFSCSEIDLPDVLSQAYVYLQY